MLPKETSSGKNNNHIHRLVRVNLQTCSDCGRFFVTTYTRTKNGELVLTELELDLKVKSSRNDDVEVEEETCW